MNLKRLLIGLVVLLALQVFFYVHGVLVFGVALNPFLFALVSVLVFFIGNQANRVLNFNERTLNYWHFYFSIAIGAIFLASSLLSLRQVFWSYPLPTPNSDVIIQLETLLNRWSVGENPYREIRNVFNHTPFPVYMPLHWLPFAVSKYLHIDARWSGVLVYFICSAVFILFLLKKKAAFILNVSIALIPACVLWIHLYFLPEDLGVSPEYLIGGYYLLLCAGLIRKNIILITLAVICCLLSRYTFIFWLPILAFACWRTFDKKQLFFAGSSVVSSVVLFYILPFCINHWDVFLTGIRYHNNCAVAELMPRDGRPMGWTYTYGLHFAHFFRKIFEGEEAAVVTKIMRSIQGIIMLVICLLGIIKTRSKQFEFSTHLLSFLYLSMLLFFLFSPLTYRYYFFTIVILSFSILANFLFQASVESKKTPL